MEKRIPRRWALLAALGPVLLIGLGVTLGVNTTGEGTSAEGTPQAEDSALGLGLTRAGEATSEEGMPQGQPCPCPTTSEAQVSARTPEPQAYATNSPDNPGYSVTIVGNNWDAINGTWDLREEPEYSSRWRGRLAHPNQRSFGFIVLSRMREEVLRADWEKWVEVEWPGEKWLLRIHMYGDPRNLPGPTGWVGPNATDAADAEPYHYAYGPYGGGTIEIHKQ